MKTLIKKRFDIWGCYRLAWKSFAKWWIPLCFVSVIIVIFEIGPRLMAQREVKAFTQSVRELSTAILNDDTEQIRILIPRTRAFLQILSKKILRSSLYAFPFIAFLTIILLMIANRATKKKKEIRKPLLFLLYTSLIHVLMSIGKMIAFFLFIIPGVYLYIRLLFVSLVMLEMQQGPLTGIRMSWQLTRGHFWQLFLLIFINASIQFIAFPTAIGLIPVTGYVNTARATAFRMLLHEQKNN